MGERHHGIEQPAVVVPGAVGFSIAEQAPLHGLVDRNKPRAGLDQTSSQEDSLTINIGAVTLAQRYGLAWEGDHSLYEPAFNVRLGTYYFAEMMEMFGHDPLLALAAYNMGPYRVRRLLRQGRDPRPEYVDKVFLHYDAFYDDFRAAGIGWGG